MNLDSNELDFTCLLDDQPGLEQDLSLPGTDLGPPVGQSGPGPTGPNQGRPNQEHDSYYTDQRQDDFGDFSNEPTSHQQPPTQSNNPTPPTQNDSFGGGGGGGLSLGAQFLSLCNETLGDQGGLGQEFAPEPEPVQQPPPVQQSQPPPPQQHQRQKQTYQSDIQVQKQRPPQNDVGIIVPSNRPPPDRRPVGPGVRTVLRGRPNPGPNQGYRGGPGGPNRGPSGPGGPGRGPGDKTRALNKLNIRNPISNFVTPVIQVKVNKSNSQSQHRKPQERLIIYI